MKRRLFNALTLLSLLLCAAVSAWWLVSHGRPCRVELGDGSRSIHYSASLHGGSFSLRCQKLRGRIPERGIDEGEWKERVGYREWDWLGVFVRHWDDPGTKSGESFGRYTAVYVRFGLPFVLSAALPAWRVPRERRRLANGWPGGRAPRADSA